jgi:hypothetical protein
VKLVNNLATKKLQNYFAMEKLGTKRCCNGENTKTFFAIEIADKIYCNAEPTKYFFSGVTNKLVFQTLCFPLQIFFKYCSIFCKPKIFRFKVWFKNWKCNIRSHSSPVAEWLSRVFEIFLKIQLIMAKKSISFNFGNAL